jgi:acetyltransferase
VPLLIAAMGEARGLAHRHRLAEAGLACFDTPESAIAGFRHLISNRRNRAAARELPAAEVLALAPDKQAVAAAIAAARTEGRALMLQDEALALLAAYGVNVVASRHGAWLPRRGETLSPRHADQPDDRFHCPGPDG